MSAITLGIGIATNNNSKKDIEPAKADSITTLYINHFDGGGYWNSFSYYLCGPGGENAPRPGVSFTDSMKTKTPNEYDQYQYVLNIDTSIYSHIALFGYPNTWSGGNALTNDIAIADITSNGVYCGSQIPSSNKFNVGYYAYSTKTVYLLDLDGSTYSTNHYVHTFATGKSGTTWPGVEMTKKAGTNNIYFAEINSALDNVIFNNNGSNETATINGISSKDLFICYPDNGYNRSVYEAGEFIDKYMKFETVWLDEAGDGSCKSSGWYSTAKTNFLYKKEAGKAGAILAHEPTKYRLSAWAKANGDTFDPSTATFSSARITPILSVTGDNNAMTIVVIISILSITAIGGYFFFRKNRNKEEQ